MVLRILPLRDATPRTDPAPGAPEESPQERPDAADLAAPEDFPDQDYDRIRTLAIQGVTLEEALAVLDWPDRPGAEALRRAAAAHRRGRLIGSAQVKMALHDKAMQGNLAALRLVAKALADPPAPRGSARVPKRDGLRDLAREVARAVVRELYEPDARSAADDGEEDLPGGDPAGAETPRPEPVPPHPLSPS